ncbi:GDSL-type esterase/lipase family protein [Bacillus marasmi]|uniref:GDSL-type esterase/lipase family protein n=1 Tax=Bacillus marasmi TaxID=1926279 RepID=UPI0011CC429B|nr:GDSL-type esterase/lipase family protein [Bacillus marasmi]
MKKILISLYMIFALFALILFSSSAYQNQIHLVALGDSITHGTGDPLRMGYIGRFQQIYDEEHLANIKISNFGIPKYTTDDTLRQLRDKQISAAIHSADFVIVYIGTNDFRKSAQYKFEQLPNKRMNSGKIHYINNLERILTEIRKENEQATLIVFGLYHPYTEYQNSVQIQKLIEEWNEEINQTANHYRPSQFIPTIDLFLMQPKVHLYSDSIHLNSAGYELIANRLYKSMEILLNTK